MPVHALNTAPPLCQVGLNVGLAFASRQRGGPPRPANALIDTGATRTAIAPDQIQALGAQRVGQEVFTRPDGTPAWKPIYAVRIGFEPNLGDPLWPLKTHWFPITAVAVAPATPGTDVLIGQDLLAQLVLAWDGPRGRLLLMY